MYNTITLSFQVKVEPKEPLKLNMKMLSEKLSAGKREESKVNNKLNNSPYKVQV